MTINLSQITRLLKQAHGLDISIYDESFLANTIEKRIQETRCASLEDYCDYLELHHAEGITFCESLYVHYSEFFRDPLTFALLERVIIPEMVQKKTANPQKEIRIWSAGCAAGQEAYSMAILLEEVIASTHPDLNYRIFATDLDENGLADARLGCYPPDALKNVGLQRAQTWFTRQGENYVVRPPIRSHIDFSTFDLVEKGLSCPPASIFGDFDLVFCCNLLIYYQPSYRKRILEKFARCLSRGAFLVTGEAERAIALAHHYSEVYPSAAILRVKPGQGKQA